MNLKLIRRLKHWYGISQIRKNGFWFVDIPRTSSSSLKVQFGQKFGRTYAKKNLREEKNHIKGIFDDHLTSKQMIKLLGRDLWDKIFTFSIVRNPWDRAVSFYQYRINRNKVIKSGHSLMSFKEHILMLKKYYDEYRSYNSRLTYPCYEFISDNNNIIVNKVIRFENREEELKEISNKIGFDVLATVHYEKILGKNNYNEYYDSETREIIKEIYAKDIEVFGYSFE